MRVAVVIPFYEQHDKLALTLAALEQQTYPHDLIEVVVADAPDRQRFEIALEGTVVGSAHYRDHAGRRIADQKAVVVAAAREQMDIQGHGGILAGPTIPGL